MLTDGATSKTNMTFVNAEKAIFDEKTSLSMSVLC
jgi:hypothetical protein